MINREKQEVTVNTYVSGVDDYGQTRQNGIAKQDKVLMLYKLNSQPIVNNPVFNNTEMMGLVDNNDLGNVTITDENTIVIDSVQYDVLYTIPTPKYLVVSMRKSK